MKLEQLLVMRIYNLLIILQIFANVNTAHVNNAKVRILKEVENAIANGNVSIHDVSNIRDGGNSRSVHLISKSRHHHNRWNARHKIGSLFTRWTAWTKCDNTCKKSRERYCRVKRRCGFTKHIEEKLCPKLQCQKQRYTNIFQEQQLQLQPFVIPASISPSLPSIIQSTSPASQLQINSVKFKKRPSNDYHHKRHKLQVFEEIHNSDNNTAIDSNNNDNDEDDDESDFFVVKKHKRKYHKKRKPILIEVEDYDELEDEDDSNNNDDDHNSSSESYIFNKKFIKAIRTKKWRRNDKFSDKRNRQGRRNLQYNDWNGGDGIDYDYQSFTGVNYNNNNNNNNDNEYNEDDDYDDDSVDSKNITKIPPRERAVYEMLPKHRRAYTKWSEWSKCSTKCTTRRYKKCRLKIICGKEVLREIAYCYTEGTFCQQWLQGQVQKNDVKPIPSNRKEVITTNNQNSIGGTDFIMNGKGYRGPEYQPLKLKCGIAPIRSNKRNMYNLLKIIGGKASRKGEWPWQVVIFNRFKEAFCGGTLIAPNWIVTAAHCVRKVLYVRLGEHNLDFDDGTEMEYRVVKSIRHPNYDKKTVDSDIALLRLPKPMNISTWIGYSCLPKPYQKLPKNIQCTVIGWGKRRNRDQAGTSVLHQAEVPIIPMENCKNVYHDYTITNNMFCAGHKRGRIDTCAGDSGGPLLCRDSTKPNHPWTIFGITSFGDGCAKRNKFGIYTKVPNYVDWIWSVVNCNGNCKQNSLQRKL